MPQVLTENEIRIIGCLMEKSVTTPDQYPLTLNALTNACNQKSSRNPVMSLEQGTVQHTVRELKEKSLVSIQENFKRGIEKYAHRFYNAAFNPFKFDEAQFAVVCLLLLRGPQTPGELRARSTRLHAFSDNSDVVLALSSLMEEDREQLVVKLPRTPGRKDAEYMHLFAGPVDVEAYVEQVREGPAASSSKRNTVADLEKRISALEAEVSELKKHIKPE